MIKYSSEYWMKKLEDFENKHGDYNTLLNNYINSKSIAERYPIEQNVTLADKTLSLLNKHNSLIKTLTAVSLYERDVKCCT